MLEMVTIVTHSHMGALARGAALRDLAKDPEVARRALRTMWTARRFEEAVDQLFARGLMHGTMHLSIGQEASAVGTCLALRPDDLITSTHRGHSHCVAKGADLTRMMAELLAKDTGYCRGRGGSMHIADVATGNLGANGIVGGGIPIAVGAALAQQLGGTGRVVIAFFGDGAANEGAFHEAANLAAVWELPVVFVCENNHYGMSMSADEAFAIEDISSRAAAYGFPGITADGNDLQAVYEAVSAAVDRARAGDGPTLVENVTYRWKGHSKSDKNLYRTREEIAEWQGRDPIARFEDAVRGTGSLDEAEVDAARKEATRDVREAIRTANAAPAALADRDVLLDAVYAGVPA
jgi:TPP-dependent pyruvate/acetoin dehydrogenase alpha subunit